MKVVSIYVLFVLGVAGAAVAEMSSRPPASTGSAESTELCGDAPCVGNSVCVEATPSSNNTEKNAYGPTKFCKECCPEACDLLDCVSKGERCVYEQVTCIRAPCCPIAKCITKSEEPTSTCDNVRCRYRCRHIQDAGCTDTKTCVKVTCTAPEQSSIFFCPSPL